MTTLMTRRHHKALPFAPEDVAGQLVASLAIELVKEAFGGGR